MTLHSSLTDPELHEPKGCSVANTGDVYVATGTGSGSWKSMGAYGSLGIDSTSTNTSFALTAAADSTLNTNTDYTVVNAVGLWIAEITDGLTVDASTGRITATKAGIYDINFAFTYYIASTGSYEVGFKCGINGVPINRKIVTTSSGNSQIKTLTSPNHLVSLNVGDYLNIYIAINTTATVVLTDSCFAVQLVKAA